MTPAKSFMFFSYHKKTELKSMMLELLYGIWSLDMEDDRAPRPRQEKKVKEED